MSDNSAQTKAIFDLCMALHGRLDTLWQRLLYAHAAIVGVMVFFSNQSDPYLVPRILVFLFYSVNLAISINAMRESYRGLQAALSDLRKLAPMDPPSAFEQWLLSLDYNAHPRRRLALFGIIWLTIGYLLFSFLLGDAQPGLILIAPEFG